MNPKEKLSEEVKEWKRYYNTLKNAYEQLQRNSKFLQDELSLRTAQLKACQQAVDINKSLLRQAAEEHSKTEQELINFMNKLKHKLRRMGFNGNFDRLGN